MHHIDLNFIIGENTTLMSGDKAVSISRKICLNYEKIINHPEFLNKQKDNKKEKLEKIKKYFESLKCNYFRKIYTPYISEKFPESQKIKSTEIILLEKFIESHFYNLQKIRIEIIQLISKNIKN